MKVVLGNKFFYPKGGAEAVFFQERTRLLKEGHEVVDFSMRHPKNLDSEYQAYFTNYVDYYVTNGLVQKLRTAVKFIHSDEAVDKITQLIDNEQPDLVHLHNVYHQLTPSIIPAIKSRNIPVLLTVHDGKLICPNYSMLCKGKICSLCRESRIDKVLWNNCQESLFRSGLMFIEAFWHKWRRSYEALDLILTPSVFYKELIASRFSNNTIKVLPNGIETGCFIPRYDHDGYILYYGRLSKEKGIATLLEASEKLTSKPVVKVVGEGPMADSLMSRFPNVEFLGFKSGEELMNLVRGAAFTVVPSEWYENCSMVVLESMAMGKPVIGARIGGLPEQVVDGETGLLFESGNASHLAKKMDTLLRDNSLIMKMGKTARKRVESEYSLDKHMQNLHTYYEGLRKGTLQ